MAQFLSRRQLPRPGPLERRAHTMTERNACASAPRDDRKCWSQRVARDMMLAMAKKRDPPRVEVVYLVGDADEFADVFEETLEAMHADEPELKIQNVSHAIAVDAGGRTHWSAIVFAKP